MNHSRCHLSITNCRTWDKIDESLLIEPGPDFRFAARRDAQIVRYHPFQIATSNLQLIANGVYRRQVWTVWTFAVEPLQHTQEQVQRVFSIGDGQCNLLGSVIGFVLLHQTVEGLEAMKQMEMAGDYPDIIISCAGGGSNAAGLIYPFLKDKLDGTKPDLRAIFVESTASPSMTRGLYAYDWGDTAKMAPLIKMHTVGHTFIPAPVHAGGLRYHGMAPSICALLDQGMVEARAYHQNAILQAAVDFARAEGIIVAPETAHAVKATQDEALACKESGEPKVILFGASGHGHFDLVAYDTFHRRDLPDYELEEAQLQQALAELPQVVE